VQSGSPRNQIAAQYLGKDTRCVARARARLDLSSRATAKNGYACVVHEHAVVEVADHAAADRATTAPSSSSGCLARSALCRQRLARAAAAEHSGLVNEELTRLLGTWDRPRTR